MRSGSFGPFSVPIILKVTSNRVNGAPLRERPDAMPQWDIPGVSRAKRGAKNAGADTP
jgi:hypothetical protein